MSYLADTAVVGKPSGSYDNLGQLVYIAPDPPNPETFINVRLTNGAGFYTAGGTSVSGGGVLTADQGSPGLLSSAWPIKISDGSQVIGVSAAPIWVTGSIGLAQVAQVQVQGTPSVTALSGSVVGLLVGGQPASQANPSPIVPPRPTTATVTSLTASASSQLLVAANSSRLGLMVTNDSSAVLYLKFGAVASLVSYTVPLASDAYYEVPFGYAGRIDCIWASADGFALITEIVP